MSSPGVKPAFSIASTSSRTASSFEARFGAKPPSSPTAVDSPRSCSTLLEHVVGLGAPAQRLADSDGAPTGMTMNSWKSTLLSACTPPLRRSSSAPAARGRWRRRRSGTAAARARRPRPWRRRATRRGWRWRRGGPCCRCRRGRAAPCRRRAGRARRARRARRRSRRSTWPTAVAHALAAVAVAAVAQLDRLVLAGRRAGRHDGAAPWRPTRAAPRPRPSGCPASRGPRGRRRARCSLIRERLAGQPPGLA